MNQDELLFLRRELANAHQLLWIVTIQVITNPQCTPVLRDVMLKCKNDLNRQMMQLERMSYDKDCDPIALHMSFKHLLNCGELRLAEEGHDSDEQ